MTELQEKVLELLKDIDKLCQDIGVEYYLTASTLLGAMRHKGFIPWDDDADVIMTRDNWEKFLIETKGKLPESIRIDTQEENANLAMTANHFTDISTTALYRYDISNPEDTGIMVDILIMDPVPDGPIAKDTYITALTTHTELTTLSYQYSLRIGKSTHFSWYRFLSRIIGMRKTLDTIDKKAFSYDEKTSRFYVQRFAGSPHFWPKEYYGRPKYVPFENTMLPVPERAEDCLCIGFDDEWMYVPADGQLKSTHEYCVRSLTVPAKVIGNDFRQMVDQRSLTHTYVKKKKIQVKNTQSRLYQELGKDQFVEAKLQMIYAQKRNEEDFQKYLTEKDYDSLAIYFKDYIDEQCTSRYLGSSSLTGWLNWYRKCSPFLIDIGDDELYAVLTLLFHQRHLTWIGRLLKAREEIDRPLTEQLIAVEQEYDAVKATRSHFSCEEWDECRQILDEFYPKYPDNPFFIEYSLEFKLKTGYKFKNIRKELKRGLQLFPDDSVLLLLEAERLFKAEKMKKALSIYWYLSENTRQGLVLLYMKEKTENLLYENSTNISLLKLHIAIRRQIGEDDEEIIKNIEWGNYIGKKSKVKGKIKKKKVKDETEKIIEKAMQQTDEQDTLNSEAREQKNLSDDLDDIQKVKYNLLVELSEICDKYQIQYFLINKALWMAERTEDYADPNADFAVAMYPDDCIKFMQAVDQENNPNRYIDSIYTNPDFHRMSLRYCDLNTLDLAVSRSDCKDKFGIYVSIEILRHPAKNKYVNLFYRGLETGWETSCSGRCRSNRQKICKAFVKFLDIVMLGRKRSSKVIFKWLLKGPKNKNKKKVFIKPYCKNRKFYPSSYFAQCQKIEFRGHLFYTMKQANRYLRVQYGETWQVKRISQTNYNPANRVISTQISYQDYFNYLDEKHIDRISYGRNYKKFQTKYTWVVVKANKEINGYWDKLSLCGDRYRLYEEYMPIKSDIMELYHSEDVEALQGILKDYSDTALYYAKKGLNISFDWDISFILEYMLTQMKNSKDAHLLQNIRQKYPMPPINTNYIKEGM